MRFLRRLADDRRGGVLIEFAILGPMMIAMLLGIIVTGMQMQDYNSIRSAAADISRYTMIEYQKENTLDETQIAQVAVAIASSQPYNLDPDKLDATVEVQATGVTGAKKFLLTLSYSPPDLMGLFNLSPATLTQRQSIIVSN